jgi:hypothetical protein
MFPISTAPKDGTVILTDDGIVCYKKATGYSWQTLFEGWVNCENCGSPITVGYDNDYKLADPTLWMPLPSFKATKLTKDNVRSLGFLPDEEETEFSYHIWDQYGPEEFHSETYEKEPLFEIIWAVESDELFLEVSKNFNTIQVIKLPTLSFEDLTQLIRLLTKPEIKA